MSCGSRYSIIEGQEAVWLLQNRVPDATIDGPARLKEGAHIPFEKPWTKVSVELSQKVPWHDEQIDIVIAC